MKLSPYLIALLLLSVISIRAYSQEAAQRNEILNELSSVVPGKGRVAIYEDENIKN